MIVRVEGYFAIENDVHRHIIPHGRYQPLWGVLAIVLRSGKDLDLTRFELRREEALFSKPSLKHCRHASPYNQPKT